MAEKLVKMTAITRVSLGDNKVAKPGDPFDIAESEVERLEKNGAAKRVATAPAVVPRKPPAKQAKATASEGDVQGATGGTNDGGAAQGAGSGSTDDQGDGDGEE